MSKLRTRAQIVVFGVLLYVPVIAAAEAPAVQPFGPAVVVEGSPRECGLAYGKTFRPAIRAFLDTELLEAFGGKPSSKEQLLEYAAACGSVLRTECPVVAEEFQGIAE